MPMRRLAVLPALCLLAISSACTTADSKGAGKCDAVVCTASDACHDAGTCDPTTGLCSNPAKEDGTACDDADACTRVDSCQAGTCTGSSPVVCGEADACEAGSTCDPQTGACFVPASAECTCCHGSPPGDATHLVHSGGAGPPTAYGSLEPLPDATSYGFACGHCHPLDPARHQDGAVQVELFADDPDLVPPIPTDPFADGDRRSLKRASPLATYSAGSNVLPGDVATYTDGTCSSVYCHSEVRASATNVPFPAPLTGAPRLEWDSVTAFSDASLDRCCAVPTDDYADFAVTVTRVYASPKWSGESYSGPAKCGHCHGYPPREGQADSGAGQSHAWINEYSYEDGHFWNKGAGWPIQCRRCHAQTVAGYLPPTAWSYDAGAGDRIVFSAPMSIADARLHVNGKKDVAFDLSPESCSTTSRDLGYDAAAANVPCLKTATWDPATRACSAVECHLSQTRVVWGTPYRSWDIGGPECNSCHQY